MFGVLLYHLRRFLSDISFTEAGGYKVAVQAVFQFIVRRLHRIGEIDGQITCRFCGISEEMCCFVYLYTVEFQCTGILVHLVTARK